MVGDLQQPNDWLLLSMCVARMGELHPVYRSRLGYARRDLETAMRAGRISLRGRSTEALGDPPVPITFPITNNHRLDLIHNSLSQRKLGLLDGATLFRDVEVEWTGVARYLRALAAESWIGTEGYAAPRADAKHRPFTKTNASVTAADYIAEQQKANRRATLKGCEEFAREAGYRGDRELLRDAFRQKQRVAGIPVRRGRPKNSPS
jgi:hypothetical protein